MAAGSFVTGFDGLDRGLRTALQILRVHHL